MRKTKGALECDSLVRLSFFLFLTKKVYFKTFYFGIFTVGTFACLFKIYRLVTRAHDMDAQHHDDGVLGDGGLDLFNVDTGSDPYLCTQLLDDMGTEPCAPVTGPAPPPFVKTTIYSDGDALAPGEVSRVLRKAFGSVLDVETCRAEATVEEVVEGIQDRINYKVVKIERIGNYGTRELHQTFAKVHGIHNFREVYHGTSKTNARKIENEGLRACECIRNMFGRGIYTTSSALQALLYANLDGPELDQCFFVMSLLQGHSAIFDGKAPERCVDDQGRPLHTTTNPEGTIFCARYESQLDATHLVTVRYLLQRKLTPEIRYRVSYFQPDLWKLIKTPKNPQPEAVAVQPDRKQDPERHYNFVVGDSVTLNITTPKWKKAFDGQGAVIKRLAYKNKNQRVAFYVEVDGQGAAVKKANQDRKGQPVPGPMDPSWLECWYSEVSSVVGSVLGKRK